MYNDPVLSKYINLIKDNMPGVFKWFYQGDPFRIPSTNLPALIISKSNTLIGPLTNAEDTHSIGISITVVTDIRNDRDGNNGSNDNIDMTPGIATLYNIIEGRDDTTYALKAQSILGILRKNQLVDQAYNLRTDLNTLTKADYGLTMGKRTAEGYATEGSIDFLANYVQNRN